MSEELRCKNCTRSLLEVDRYIEVPVPADLTQIKWVPEGCDFVVELPKVDNYCLSCWNTMHPQVAIG